MSVEALDSTLLTAEQNVEVQQESSQASNEESGVQVLADDTSDETVIPDESTRPHSSHQDTVDIDDTNMQDSPKSLISDDVKGMESQKGEVGGSRGKCQQDDFVAGTETQVCERDATESQQGGATSGTESQPGGATGGTESQQGGATGGTESQQGGATGGVGRQLSQDSSSSGVKNAESLESRASFKNSKFPFVALGSLRQDSNNSFTDYSQEGASRRPYLVSGAAGDISNRQDLEDSGATGDSQETAVVGDLSNQNSLESGDAGDISNSPLESPPNSSESWESMAVPAHPWRTSERRREAEESPRSYELCFRCCSFLCDYMRPMSRRVIKSDIFMGIRIFLIFVAVLVAGAGLGHLYTCPAKIELPILEMLMGVVGIVVLLGSLGMDNRRMDCPNVHVCLLRAGMVIARLMFLGLFGAVLHFTYTVSPSFDNRNENYCDEGFYHFVYYTNFIIGAMVVAAFFIYVPALNDDEIHYEQL